MNKSFIDAGCTVEANGGHRCTVECCYPVTCRATPGAPKTGQVRVHGPWVEIKVDEETARQHREHLDSFFGADDRTDPQASSLSDEDIDRIQAECDAFCCESCDVRIHEFARAIALHISGRKLER